MSSGFHAPDLPSAHAYDQCVRCGLCLPTCPTYVETHVETSGPRGRIALVRAVDQGRLDLTDPGFVHQMSECLDCRACEAVCPSGVEYGKLLEPARAQLERVVSKRREPFAQAVRYLALDVLFSRLALMRVVARVLRFYQRSGLQRLVRASGVLRVLGLAALEAQTPPISRRFFMARGQRYPAEGTRKAAAVLHAGCVMHVAFAEVDSATARVLARSGCDVTVPRAQGCCGAIAIHAGDLDLGRRLAKKNIAGFERSGAELYVTSAAGCGSALKEYGTLFAEDPAWAQRARRFSSCVRDVTELLDAIGIAPELGDLPLVVTYQEPCHLVHAQSIASAPRNLLRRIPKLELREMNESALCCGSAGIYALTQPEMSDRLARRKATRIAEVAPDIVATANPGCALQVRRALRSADVTAGVAHVVELLDRSYAAYRPDTRSSPASAASTVG